MKRIYQVSAFALLLAAGACAAPNVDFPPPVVSQREVYAIRVKVAREAELSGDGAAEVESKAHWKTGFPQALRAHLQSSGFRVVDGDQEADVLAKQTVSGIYVNTLGSATDASVAVSFVRASDGKPLAEVKFGSPGTISYDEWAAWVAKRVVGEVLASPAIRDEAQALIARGAPVAPAPPPVEAAAAAPAPPPREQAAPSMPAARPSGEAAYVAAAPQPGAYALVVGIDRYRDVPAATGARADAEHFAQLAKQTLGLRDDHIRLATEDHATRTDILGGLKWLKESVSAGGRVYFFFSGHGAPTPDSSTYILPYDGNPKDVPGTAVSVSQVMTALGETKAKEVLAIVDACFSGAGGRSVLPPGARPLMRVKEAAPSAHMALFTASQGDEISGPAPGESVGVFTKFVVQGLGTGQADINGDGQVSLQELSEWVSPRVARDAKKDKREQHPKLVVGAGVGGPGSFIVEYGLATK